MAKLTKEEKAAKKEAAKKAKLAKALELRKQLKQEELSREIKAQSLKRTELDKALKEMMLQVKMPEFIKQVQIIWHTFERAYDKKDCLIHHVFKVIEQAHGQYERTLAVFCQILDNMTNKFFADMEELSRLNAEKTAKLLKQGEDEASNIMRDHTAAETHLQLLIYHGHTEADDLAWRTRGENLVKVDDERDRCINERDDLRSFLENNFTLMWEEYKSVLKRYVTSTADNQKKVRRLRKKENLMADIIAMQAKQMIDNQRKIKSFRLELQQYESGEKQAAFRERRDKHRVAYWGVKRALLAGSALDRAQLHAVVKATNGTAQQLTKMHKKGEKILRLAAICRKFETQKEKVLPFGCEQPHEPLQCEKNTRGRVVGDPLICEELVQSGPMCRLWQRMSRANVSFRALGKEKEFLIKENKLLEQRLREYQDKRVGALKCSCDLGPCTSPTNINGNESYKRIKFP